MHAKRTGLSAVQHLFRSYVELLTLLAVLFVLQTGLAPLGFNAGGSGTGSSTLLSTTPSRLMLPDVISNILLYVPIGVLGYWTLWRRCRRKGLLWPATVAMAAALSLCVESLQAFLPSRVSSCIDVVSNVAGTGLGASLSWVARRILPPFVGAAAHEFHQRPRPALLKAYALLLIVLAAAPFSFSFDVWLLRRAAKSVVFVPFGTSRIEQQLERDWLTGTDPAVRARLQGHRMKRWSRWAAECVSFGVLAWLLQSVVRRDYGFHPRAATLLVWWLGGLFAIGLSVLQLPLVSRTSDVTDVGFRLLGLGMGQMMRSVYLSDQAYVTSHFDRWGPRRLAKVGCVAVTAYIVYTGLIPMQFAIPAAKDGSPVGSIVTGGFLPFFGYATARFDVMVSDALEKLTSYALFSVFLATCWKAPSPACRQTARGERNPRLLAVTVAGVSLSILIEALQVFIPVRVTSLTDPILAGAGCVVGVIGQKHAAAFYRFARSRPPRAQEPPRQPSAEVIGDTLLATLSDPNPQAPSEPGTGSSRFRRRHS